MLFRGKCADFAFCNRLGALPQRTHKSVSHRPSTAFRMGLLVNRVTVDLWGAVFGVGRRHILVAAAGRVDGAEYM